jgi:hypothetical protein
MFQSSVLPRHCRDVAINIRINVTERPCHSAVSSQQSAVSFSPRRRGLAPSAQRGTWAGFQLPWYHLNAALYSPIHRLGDEQWTRYRRGIVSLTPSQQKVNRPFCGEVPGSLRRSTVRMPTFHKPAYMLLLLSFNFVFCFTTIFVCIENKFLVFRKLLKM